MHQIVFLFNIVITDRHVFCYDIIILTLTDFQGDDKFQLTVDRLETFYQEAITQVTITSLKHLK